MQIESTNTLLLKIKNIINIDSSYNASFSRLLHKSYYIPCLKRKLKLIDLCYYDNESV